MSKKLRVTYHSLLATLFAISAFNVENKQVAGFVAVKPDALGSLLTSLRLVHDLECSVEEQVE